MLAVTSGVSLEVHLTFFNFFVIFTCINLKQYSTIGFHRGKACGIDVITIDVKGKKLTVIGTVDPVSVVSKLRKKNLPTDILSVGPAKEPEKKVEPKKEEPKKEETKKEEPKQEEPKKEEPKKEEAKEETKKEEPKKEEEKKAEPAPAPALAPAPAPAPAPTPMVGTVMPYRPYYPPMNTQYYLHHSMEENPNSCVIC